MAAAALASTAVPDALSALSEAAEEASAAEPRCLPVCGGYRLQRRRDSAAGGFDGNMPAGDQDAVAEGVVEGAAVGLGGSVSAAPYTGLENVTTSGTSSLQLGFVIYIRELRYTLRDEYIFSPILRLTKTVTSLSAGRTHDDHTRSDDDRESACAIAGHRLRG